MDGNIIGAKTIVPPRAAAGCRCPPLSAIPPVSPLLWRLFGRYTESYIGRFFHAVRLSRAGLPAAVSDRPLVIFLNHPSWWDPLLCLFLAQRFFPDRTHYGPIDAKALAHYRFFSRLGFFGVTPGTRQGARTFIRTSQAILQQPGTALWITPEGQFTDPRQRPIRLQPGVGYLARRLSDVAFVPLALEYPFWETRFPEVLVRFGEPLSVAPTLRPGLTNVPALLAARLQATQDALAWESCRRQTDDFEVLLRGRAGMGGIYDIWCTLRHGLRGGGWRRVHGDQ